MAFGCGIPHKLRTNNMRKEIKMVKDIYSNIAERTNGDIYIGVVGPVRTGKSTFIKRFMENLVIPNIIRLN